MHTLQLPQNTSIEDRIEILKTMSFEDFLRIIYLLRRKDGIGVDNDNIRERLSEE